MKNKIDQWIIDIYNNGQNKYIFKINNHPQLSHPIYEMILKNGKGMTICEGRYDFLFNPEFDFAMVFSGYIYHTDQCYKLCGGHNVERDHSYEAVQFELQRELLEEMATTKDPIKGLKIYKE